MDTNKAGAASHIAQAITKQCAGFLVATCQAYFALVHKWKKNIYKCDKNLNQIKNVNCVAQKCLLFNISTKNKNVTEDSFSTVPDIQYGWWHLYIFSLFTLLGMRSEAPPPLSPLHAILIYPVTHMRHLSNMPLCFSTQLHSKCWQLPVFKPPWQFPKDRTSRLHKQMLVRNS